MNIECFSPKMKAKARVFTITLPIQYCTKALVTAIRHKRNKIHTDVEKENITRSLLIRTIIAYMENFQSSIKKLLDLINEFNMAA